MPSSKSFSAHKSTDWRGNQANDWITVNNSSVKKKSEKIQIKPTSLQTQFDPSTFVNQFKPLAFNSNQERDCDDSCCITSSQILVHQPEFSTIGDELKAVQSNSVNANISTVSSPNNSSENTSLTNVTNLLPQPSISTNNLPASVTAVSSDLSSAGFTNSTGAAPFATAPIGTKKRPQIVITEKHLQNFKPIKPGNQNYNTAVRDGQRVLVLSDSMLLRIRKKEFNQHLNTGYATFQRYPGAKAKHLDYHVIPSLIEQAPSTLLVHGGTNSLLDDKTPEEIATDIIYW